MLRVKEAIVVEGRYDKNTLSQLVDTVILSTDGFGIFKNEELMALLRRLALTRGLIVLTDSDGAGFLIRGHLKGALPREGVKHAYIPDVYGKERRKRTPGKEGKLGVEGMSPAVLEEALRRAGATFLETRGRFLRPLGEGGEEDWETVPSQEDAGTVPLSFAGTVPSSPPITKADLYALGLTGAPEAAAWREELLRRLELPARMTPNALLPVLNALYSREEFWREAGTWS